MKITNLILMKNQAVTKVIQMFPPKPRRNDGRPARRLHSPNGDQNRVERPAGVYAVRMASETA